MFWLLIPATIFASSGLFFSGIAVCILLRFYERNDNHEKWPVSRSLLLFCKSQTKACLCSIYQRTKIESNSLLFCCFYLSHTTTDTQTHNSRICAIILHHYNDNGRYKKESPVSCSKMRMHSAYSNKMQ